MSYSGKIPSSYLSFCQPFCQLYVILKDNSDSSYGIVAKNVVNLERNFEFLVVGRARNNTIDCV